MDTVVYFSDVTPYVALYGFGWVFLGFLCGAIVTGALLYVLTRI